MYVFYAYMELGTYSWYITQRTKATTLPQNLVGIAVCTGHAVVSRVSTHGRLKFTAKNQAGSLYGEAICTYIHLNRGIIKNGA